VLGLLFFLSGKRRKKGLALLGDWKLVQQMFPLESLQRRRMKDVILLFSFLLLIVSAAGPQFGSIMKEFKHRGVDVFIAIDISKSMMAEDVIPSRLERAKQSLSLLVKKLQGHRVGVIAFAKDAFLQCPLTIDIDAAQMFLEILDTNSVPRQGTSIGDAIRLALDNFPKDEKSGKAVVLLTDGEDHKSDPEGAAKEAKEKGVVLFTIGIGTSKGEVIKNKNEQGQVIEYQKYQGEMVLTKLDDGLLNKLALTTGGQYYRSSSTDREIDEISDIINGFEKKELNTKTHERLVERFQYFAFIVFLFLILEYFISEKFGQLGRVRNFLVNSKRYLYRNKKNMALLLFILFSQTVQADFKDHILTGNKLIKKKDLTGARKEFESARNDNPDSPIPVYNIANSYYLEGKFDEAEKEYLSASNMTLDSGFKSQVAYNLGHLYFNMDKRDQSLEQFKECLRLNPADVDAKYNIEYILSGKIPKNPPQPQQKKDEGDNNNKDNKPQDARDDNKDQKSGDQSEQNKDGLSKEDAERVLQMMKDQESEKLKNAIILRPGQKKPEKKEQESGEDW
ncbi:MAG: VWA domain-containing protein, partial [Elusimicrobiota bacterium]